MIIFDRSHSAQTPGPLSGYIAVSFPTSRNRACNARTRARSPVAPAVYSLDCLKMQTARSWDPVSRGSVSLPPGTPPWTPDACGGDPITSLPERAGLGAVRDFSRIEFEPMSQHPKTIYAFSAPLFNGRSVTLAEFRGRAMLIVNTASLCGFTPQYAGLEALYRAYRDRGFEVLGFPCNQFGRQEPGTDAEIGAFCKENYDVSFPIFARIDVNGPHAHPLYRFLKREKPGIFGLLSGGRIPWNFTKFLIGRDGKVEGRYGPVAKPTSLASAIERLLGAT